jgi:hypothetical protein
MVYNPRMRHALLAVLAASTVSIAAAQAPPPNTLTAAEKQAGWTLLFDGTTLGGWKSYDPASDATKGWVIDNGAIKNTKGSGRPNSNGGDIVTAAMFTDFDFRFEWKISPGGNSGVKYLVLERLGAPGTPMYVGDDGRSAIGHEYQLIDDDNHADAKIGPHRQTGAFYDVLAAPATKKTKPVGEFNESRILVQGTHVEHWLNGAKIVEYELETPAIVEAIAKSKFRNVEQFSKKASTRILLQDHGDEVWFRNLKIRTTL